MEQSPQTFSHYPSFPLPVKVPLDWSMPHACSYLPGKIAEVRAISVRKMSPEIYHDFMDAGFRRSGHMVYQPVCAGCRSCRPIRVPVAEFMPDKTQRRCWKKNQDLLVSIGQPSLTEQKFDLYRRYQSNWHGSPEKSSPTMDELESFLYQSPVNSIEFCYRDRQNRLMAVGICDVCSRSLSSVYFYFDPAHAHRSLGTFGALQEIQHAKTLNLSFYYLGYYIYNCASMSYKANFNPCQLLGSDGIWRDQSQEEGLS